MRKLKAQLSELPSSAIAVVVLVIIVSMGVLVLAGMNSSTTNADAQAVIGKGIDAMGTYGDWFTTIVLVVIAGVIIAIVIGVFAFRRMSGGRS